LKNRAKANAEHHSADVTFVLSPIVIKRV